MPSDQKLCQEIHWLARTLRHRGMMPWPKDIRGKKGNMPLSYELQYTILFMLLCTVSHIWDLHPKASISNLWLDAFVEDNLDHEERYEGFYVADNFSDDTMQSDDDPDVSCLTDIPPACVELSGHADLINRPEYMALAGYPRQDTYTGRIEKVGTIMPDQPVARYDLAHRAMRYYDTAGSPPMSPTATGSSSHLLGCVQADSHMADTTTGAMLTPSRPILTGLSFSSDLDGFTVLTDGCDGYEDDFYLGLENKYGEESATGNDGEFQLHQQTGHEHMCLAPHDHSDPHALGRQIDGIEPMDSYLVMTRSLEDLFRQDNEDCLDQS